MRAWAKTWVQVQVSVRTQRTARLGKRNMADIREGGRLRKAVYTGMREHALCARTKVATGVAYWVMGFEHEGTVVVMVCARETEAGSEREHDEETERRGGCK